MKNRELLDLYGALKSMESRKYNVKFSYFLAKNKVVIKDEYKILEEAGKPSEKFTEYDTKRAQLAHKYADRNENDGQPKVENNNFVIIKNADKFKEELDKLKKQYEKTIKEQEESFKQFEALLDEEAQCKRGPQISIKDIPDHVEPSILEILIIADLIKEDDEE